MGDVEGDGVVEILDWRRHAEYIDASSGMVEATSMYLTFSQSFSLVLKHLTLIMCRRRYV